MESNLPIGKLDQAAFDFVPGFSGNGAEFINLMYLLRSQYHVYVLDSRNQASRSG